MGTNPTFQGSRRTVEAYLLDFDGDLYGEHVGVEFVHRLRPMTAFTDVAALVAAMADDVATTRDLLPGDHPAGGRRPAGTLGERRVPRCACAACPVLPTGGHT